MTPRGRGRVLAHELELDDGTVLRLPSTGEAAPRCPDTGEIMPGDRVRVSRSGWRRDKGTAQRGGAARRGIYRGTWWRRP